MLAGWSAIAAAILTITGLIALLAFFGTGSTALGALSDSNTILMALVTVPVALALHTVASGRSGWLATGALGANFVGVLLAAGFSASLLAQAMSFNDTLLPITIGNGLIGVWLLVTAALLLAASAVPAQLGWLGIVGGTGLVIASIGFPLLGREHPLIAAGGLMALVGLVAFYGWAGVLLLQSRLGADRPEEAKSC